jgi:hypothetical protein
LAIRAAEVLGNVGEYQGLLTPPKKETPVVKKKARKK